jgi:hypothetical protein
MGKKLNIKFSDWWLILLGFLVVILSGTTLTGIATSANDTPFINMKALFIIGLLREGLGWLYRILKTKELPDDDK